MNARTTIVVSSFVATAIAASMPLAGQFGKLPWMVNRATGVVAFALLSISVIAGLLMSTKTGARLLLSRPRVFAMHQYVSSLAVGFIIAHGLVLLFDGFLALTPFEIVIPFAAPYARLRTGLGVTAAWMIALVWASWSFRPALGPRRWRQLHYLSFVAYLLALGHGVFGGTDTTVPAIAAMYIISAGSVTGFIAYRVAAAFSHRGDAARGRARGVVATATRLRKAA